ncbi:putative protein Tchh [Crotalus adamanteus]|uniref:EF-hand domain-containing protein n=1 Tax=Crotalus adamanteus TaxID=8729 RepID=A0AAW1AM94_CROAD
MKEKGKRIKEKEMEKGTMMEKKGMKEMGMKEKEMKKGLKGGRKEMKKKEKRIKEKEMEKGMKEEMKEKRMKKKGSGMVERKEKGMMKKKRRRRRRRRRRKRIKERGMMMEKKGMKKEKGMKEEIKKEKKMAIMSHLDLSLFFHYKTSNMCEEMSHLLRNIRSIICIFEKYAQDDGDCSTLSKGELKQLIQTEFADVIVEPYDPKTIETVLHLLDTDCDGKVGFEEFTVLVFKVVKACYKKVQECQGPAGRPSKRNNTSMQQQEIPSQHISRDGPSKQDSISMQQREIPPQQVSRQGPSQQDTTSMQQREIPSQQASRDGPSQRDTTSMQQREIPPQQASRDGPSQRDTTSMQQREIPPQQASRDGPSQRDISRTQQREIPFQQVSRDGPSQRDTTSMQQREIPPQQVSRDGPSQRDNTDTQQWETQTPQVSPRPCQKLVRPKEVLDREELPQKQEREKTRLETSYDEQSQQEEASTHPATQTSRVQSVQKTIEDMIRGNLTSQTSWAEMRTEETSAWGALPSRRRCLQEPLSPDQEANQGVLQSAPQQSSQQRQVEEPSTICQEEVTSQTSVQERKSQQSAVEMEQISAGKVTCEPSQETLQRSSGGRNQQAQVEERRSASSSHSRNPQVVQICDQESRSVTLGQRDDQKRSQSQGVEQRSVAQQDQEVQALGQVISRRQEPQMPVYRPHQEKERYPATLEQCQRGPSEQRATSQEVTRPQMAERYPRVGPLSLDITRRTL